MLLITTQALIGISIHALLWSATFINLADNEVKTFLSTHSCGVRHVSGIIRGQGLYFYPRTPVECD